MLLQKREAYFTAIFSCGSAREAIGLNGPRSIPHRGLHPTGSRSRNCSRKHQRSSLIGVTCPRDNTRREPHWKTRTPCRGSQIGTQHTCESRPQRSSLRGNKRERVNMTETARAGMERARPAIRPRHSALEPCLPAHHVPLSSADSSILYRLIYAGCIHQSDAVAPAGMAKDGREKPMARVLHGKVRCHVSHLYHRPHWRAESGGESGRLSMRKPLAVHRFGWLRRFGWEEVAAL